MWSVISVFVCLCVVYICFCEITCLTLDQSQNGLGSPRLFASQIPLGAAGATRTTREDDDDYVDSGEEDGDDTSGIKHEWVLSGGPKLVYE